MGDQLLRRLVGSQAFTRMAAIYLCVRDAHALMHHETEIFGEVLSDFDNKVPF